MYQQVRRGVGDFDESDGGVIPYPQSGGGGSWASGIDWGSIIKTAVGATSNIFSARYAVPPPGTMIQTPQGTIVRQPQYGSQFNLGIGTGFGSTGSYLPWLLLGGLVLGGVALVSRSRG